VKLVVAMVLNWVGRRVVELVDSLGGWSVLK
jgi:hypothetical protein